MQIFLLSKTFYECRLDGDVVVPLRDEAEAEVVAVAPVPVLTDDVGNAVLIDKCQTWMEIERKTVFNKSS